MRRIINFDEDEQHYKWAIDYNEKAGLKSTVFASKEIPIKDAEKFMKEYNLAKSTIDKESKYLALAKLMETDLKFEGIVGFKNSLKHDAEPALTMLREMGVNVHIVSGDNLEHNMMVVQQLKLINEKDKLITYSFSDVETGKSQIKKGPGHHPRQPVERAQERGFASPHAEGEPGEDHAGQQPAPTPRTLLWSSRASAST
jgi:magnesium-transporting ATPase (P-type)